MFLIALTSLISAQETAFKLSDYKLPELDYHRLDTRISLSGSKDNEYSPQVDSLINQEKNDNTSSSNRGDLQLSYYHYINSKTLQRNTYATGSFDFNFSKDETEGEVDLYERETKNYGSYLVYDLENKFYYKPNTFFGLDTRVLYNYDNYNYYRYSSDNSSDSYKDDDNNNSNVIDLNVDFKYGFGRIENVEDARHAYIILDELTKAGSITKDYNNEDILELAKLISQLNRERFFDSRHKKIFIYEQLDSFLLANDYISEGDIKYFATLSDTWLYGSSQSRLNGRRISFTASSDIELNFASFNETSSRPSNGYVYDPVFDTNVKVTEQVESKQKENRRNQYYNLSAGVEYDYEHALNIKWQHSISAHMMGGVLLGSIKSDIERDDVTIDSVDFMLKNPNLDFAFEQGVSFFPDTRTSLSCKYFVNYAQLFYPSSSDFLNIKGQGFRIGTDLSAYYYVSPQLRLSASWNLFYEWQNSDEGYSVGFDTVFSPLYYYSTRVNSYSSSGFKEKKFYSTFQVSLTYSIF